MDEIGGKTLSRSQDGDSASRLYAALLARTLVSADEDLMRAFGKDPLRLKWQKDAESYWIVRDPPGPLPNTMSKQF